MKRRAYLLAAPIAALISISVAYTDMLICGVPAPIARIVAIGSAIVGVVITLPLIDRAQEERVVPKEEPVSHYDEEGQEKLRALNAEFEVMPRWMYEDLSRQEVARFSSLLQKHYAYVDFERLAQEYDGIWLTEQGNAATHLSYPHNLNGWDVESVLWFRWCFTHVEQVRVESPMKLDGLAREI